MKNIKISELDEHLNLQDNHVFPVVSEEGTRKIKYATIRSQINKDLQPTFTRMIEEKIEDIPVVEPYDDTTIKREINNLKNKTDQQDKELDNKVDKIIGKDLSTNDFTNKYKSKLDGLSNYDDTELKEELQRLYNNQLSNKVEGTDLNITDSADMKCNISLTGNIKQDTTTGKNLFDFSKWYKNKSGIYMTNATIEINNDSIIISNPTSTDAYTRGAGHMNTNPSEKEKTIVKSYGTEVKPETKYTLSFLNKNQCKSEIYVFQYDEDYKYLKMDFRGVNTLKNNFITFTTDSNCKYISFRLDNEGYGTNVTTLEVTNIQLEESSTATDYEPYTNGASPNPDYPQDIKVVTGNNEVNVSNRNLLSTPFTKDNKLTDTATKDDYSKMTDYYVELEAGNTYCFNFETDGTIGHDNTNNMVEVYFAKDKKYENAFRTIKLPEYYTPTVSGKYYMRYDVNKSGETHSFWNFYVAQEDTFSGYVPYQEQTYPLSLGDKELYKDEYPFKKDGKWYWHKEYMKIILTGSEKFNQTSAGTNQERFDINLATLGVPKGLNPSKSYCNYFSLKQTITNTWGNYYITDYLVFNNNDTKMKSLDEFKNWLKNQYDNGTPVEIVYQLATPIDEEITDTTLINQLEELSKAMTYKNVTNISSNAGSVKPILKVNYYQDLQTVINNLTAMVVNNAS